MVATVGALSIAFKRMQQRDTIGYQRWLRARVLAQGLTIVAMVVAGVQESGIGVLTGNAFQKGQQQQNSVSLDKATAEWEHQEFEKRLKAAEEAHSIESGDVGKARTFVPPPATTGTVQSTNVPPSSTTDAGTVKGNGSSSGWLSWLGWSRK